VTIEPKNLTSKRPMTNDFDDTTYQHRKELQIALRTFSVNLNPTFFVCLNFNTQMTHRSAKRLLSRFQRKLDRKLFGKRFYKLPRERRIFFLAMPEGIYSNYHYHMLLTLPPKAEDYFVNNAERYLKYVLPAASLQISKLATATDERMTSFYSCKDAIYAENYNNFVVSTQFASI